MQTKPSWRRILRAFWQALQMTLRGQIYTRPSKVSAEARDWIEQGQVLTRNALSTADTHGLDETARKQHVLTVEGRPISMQTILAGVQHNFEREYMPLLDSGLEHSWLTLMAFNMNDRYRLTQLAESLAHVSAVQQAIMTLEAHLAVLPRPPQKSPTALK